MSNRILPAIALAACCLSVALGQTPAFPKAADLPRQQEAPDPLVLMNGKTVKTAAQWKSERRPELRNLFQHYMYGYFPKAERVSAVDGKSYNDALGGKALMKEVTLKFSKPGAPSINVLMVLPKSAKGRVPVVLGINFCGNHSVLPDPRITLAKGWLPNSCFGVKDNAATENSRGKGIDSQWDIERAIDRGYAVATFYHGDLAPDKPGKAEGVFQHFKNPEGISGTPSDWGHLAAWAWGAQRVADYLVANPAIDSKRVAIFGHSRNGKAAILAGAFDERFALVLSHQAGCGGTSPSRGLVGEKVVDINTRFPHWFNDVFKEFNNDTARLPFDQNSLIALVAPRPILLSNAEEDTWANPAGQFQMLQKAEPVYKLLGAGGLETSTIPDSGKLSSGTLGFFIRPGKHSTTHQNWGAFLDFADRHFGRMK